MPKSLAEIARLSNVSSATASRVVNNHPRVGAETRRRVLEVIQRYGFEPNAAARALASSRTGAIGVVVPVDVAALHQNPWVAEIVRGLADEAREQDIALMLILESVRSQERVNKVITNFVTSRRVDGLINSNSLEGDLLAPRLSELGFPHITIGAPHCQEDSFVDVRNKEMAFQVTQHMIDHGWTRFALLGGPDYMSVSKDREQGFFEAISAAGLDTTQVQVLNAEFTGPEVGNQLQALLTSENAPNAIVAMSDVLANELLRSAFSLGLEPGKDIGIAAFDDLLFRINAAWGLTTMAQPVYEMGRKALQLVSARLQEPDKSPDSALFDGNLVIRTSCGCSHHDDDALLVAGVMQPQSSHQPVTTAG